jgi:hypothetical protein
VADRLVDIIVMSKGKLNRGALIQTFAQEKAAK